MKRLLSFLTLISLFYSCTSDSAHHPDVSDISMNVKIRRLEQELFKLQTKEEINAFLKNNPLFKENFLQASQYPHDSIIVSRLHTMVTDHNLDTLYQQTQTVFADLSGLEKEFSEAFKHVKYYYPQFKAPEIYTLVTGFGSDLFVSDSLIVIGLDYYLGDKGKYRPDGPNYILKRYRPEYLVPSALSLLSQQYNVIDALDRTLLADMLFYGKAYEFTQNMMPDTPDSLIIGYSDIQLTDTEDNQAVVWAHFIEKKLLYETTTALKTKYTGERPYTAEISQSCPGGIGRWLGWKIVREYRLRHPEIKLPDLMKTKDAKLIFAESKYKGK
ncbi:MAG: gliding motility lipoprotein GldB [Bacteroidota bacterium]